LVRTAEQQTRAAANPGRGGVLRRVPGIGNDLGLGHNNLVLFWAMLFNELSFGFYQTLAPIYIESLGASPGLVGVVIGIQGLVRIVFLLPAGWIADHVPLRTLIVGGRSLSVLGTLLFGLAQEWWHLLPAIVVMAAGNVSFPAISKAIADSTDDASRTRAFTLIYTVAPSSALLISPVLGGLLADAVALRAIFFAAAVAQAVSVFFFTRLRPVESHAGPASRVSYRDVLTYRPILIICSVFMAMLLILTTGFTLVPNYLQDVHDVGIGTIGQFGSVFALGSIILGIVIARVKALASPLNALLLTTVLCPVAYLLYFGGGSVWVFALAFLFRGGYLVSWSLVYAALGEVTPERLRSRSFALSEVLGGLGFAIAPFIAGALYEVDPALPLLAATAGTIPLLLVMLAVRRYLARRALAAVVA
jgi:MFS family permease